jgi:hypothetical protein
VVAFSIVFCAVLFACFALVGDGTRVMAARERALAVAEQAARAGAGSVSATTLVGGQPVFLDEAGAVRRASAYAASNGFRATVQVRGDHVSVVVERFEPFSFLVVFGLSGVTVRARADAVAVAYR